MLAEGHTLALSERDVGRRPELPSAGALRGRGTHRACTHKYTTLYIHLRTCAYWIYLFLKDETYLDVYTKVYFRQVYEGHADACRGTWGGWNYTCGFGMVEAPAVPACEDGSTCMKGIALLQ